ncbi:MAG: hypothetical protein NC204_05910 [Candidatus Amulumruptor caecigallinarius]|nr:hypothetical protein [Candidatus Amulumruptor caecigallinarius]
MKNNIHGNFKQAILLKMQGKSNCAIAITLGINKALQDVGNHYHFVARACRPRKPTDKAQVEPAVRCVYNRVYAKLRHQIFHSIEQLNEALAKATLEHNQTRMQRRLYSSRFSN